MWRRIERRKEWKELGKWTEGVTVEGERKKVEKEDERNKERKHLRIIDHTCKLLTWIYKLSRNHDSDVGSIEKGSFDERACISSLRPEHEIMAEWKKISHKRTKT